MKCLLIIIAASVTLFASALEAPATQPASATATTHPTAAPTTQFSREYSRREDRYSSRSSNGYPVQRLRDTPYSLLESRSIFYKGRLPTYDPNRTYTQTAPTTNRTTDYGPPPERSLVFRGATDFDNDYFAFVENFNNGQIQTLQTGDPIANGKVGMITLNSLDYINKSGKTTHVLLGKTLEGLDPPTTQPSYIAASPTPTPGSTLGSTATPPTPSAPSSASIEATLARLRAKRAAEGGN